MSMRKIMSLVIPIVFMFQLTIPAKTETETANLLQEQKILSGQFDLDRMIAYVVSDRSVLMVLDIKNPEEPVPIAQMDLEAPETVTDMQIHEGVIYVTGGNRLQVIDVSDPYHPSASYYTCVETGESLKGLVICGTRAYLYDQRNIHVYSLENPALPGFLKSYEVNDPDSACSISGIAVRDGIVYAALGDEGIHIFDFTDLNEIKYAGKLNDVSGSSTKILSSGDLLFFPEGKDKLHVVDITSPETVRQVGLAGLTGSPVCIRIKEGRVYILGDQFDICVLDIDSLSSPQPESSSPAEKQENKADKKIAYITIDDGPSRNNTPKNLDTLKKYGVKATFFVLPKENLDDIYGRILEEGHVIGNHSSVHDYNYLFGSVENFRSDVLKAQNFIYERFQYKSTVYRFPGGTMGRSKSVIRERSEILKELGYKYFDWDVSTADTDPNLKKIGSEGQIVDKLANNVIKGANGRKKLIVLMHDSAGKAYTAKALPMIIEGLQKQGYAFDVLTNY